MEGNAAMILPGETPFVGALKNALLPLGLSFSIAGSPRSNTIESVSAAIPQGDIGQTRFIFVDFRWGLSATQTPDFDITRVTLSDLQKSLSDHSVIPPAFVALAVIAGLKADRRMRAGTVVVLCAADASVAVVQVALKFGANWVWTSYMDMFGLREVVQRLSVAPVPLTPRARPRVAARSNATAKRSVFVVENGGSDIATLRNKLGRWYELYFAAVDTVPAKDLYIAPDVALAEFDRHGPFVAAIVDLALSDPAEASAATRYGSVEAALKTFTKAAPDVSMSDFQSIMGGLQVVSGLRERDQTMLIFVMSNWVNNAPVMGAIREYLGETFQSVDFYFKTEKDYTAVRDRLNATFPQEPAQ